MNNDTNDNDALVDINVEAANTKSTMSSELLNRICSNIYFCRGKYIYQVNMAGNSKQEWTGNEKMVFQRYLRKTWNIHKEDIDEIMHRIETQNTIHEFLDLGGYKQGVSSINNQIILITSNTDVVQPVKGDYSLIETLLSRMFEPEQKQELYHWLKTTYESFYNFDNYKRGQAVILVGEVGSCKDLLQDIVTSMIGNRVAIPEAYFKGETDFNSELFAATHLKVSDMPAKTEDKVNLTLKIKGWVASTWMKNHKKSHIPMICKPVARVTISMNTDDYSLNSLPMIMKSTEDKISMFYVNKPDMSDVIPMSVIRNEKTLLKTFVDQLPAFCYYLMNEHVIPANRIDNRFGAKSYQDPKVISLISVDEYIGDLMERIDAEFFIGKPNVSCVKLTPTQIQSKLNINMDARKLGQILANASQDKHYENRLVKSRTNNSRFWTIYSPDKKEKTFDEIVSEAF